ncbi:precorrin-3B synthase [Gordonia sinesedis]
MVGPCVTRLSIVTSSEKRPARDRCPGVFGTHPAADGAVARIRLVGGTIRPEQVQALAAAAAAYGDGFIELTGRGNLQLRGIGDVDAVADAVVEAGLVPSSTHETVRNIEVSPLTGRIGGLADLRPVAVELDRGLRDDAGLSALSGRFLFGLDDGRGDVVARRPDVSAILRAGDGDGSGGVIADVVVGGVPVGSVPDLGAVPGALLDVARDVVDVEPTAWRIADLSPEARDEVLGRARRRLGDPLAADIEPAAAAATGARSVEAGAVEAGAVEAGAVGSHSADPLTPRSPIVGWFDQDDGRVLLGGVVELGRIPARLAEFLAAIGAPIVMTPDREILICDLDEAVADTVVRVLAPMGLIFDATSPWAAVSCCVGAPGCDSAEAPVRRDLLERIESGDPVTEREHWVGCARGCGSPAAPHLRVEAGPDGYRESHR